MLRQTATEDRMARAQLFRLKRFGFLARVGLTFMVLTLLGAWIALWIVNRLRHRGTTSG